MKWLHRPTDVKAASVLVRELGLHPVAAGILAGRGYATPEIAERFLAARLSDLPSPFAMKGMGAAVERLVRAIRTREEVTVYGDYDVDGVTATTLLVDFLRRVGANVDYYIPNRLSEGYGMNPEAVKRLAEKGTRLIVTVDCGVTAVEEVDQAARIGVDVVVVDHHKAPLELPRAVAMLNPHQPGCNFPSKELCAVGVVFFMLMALRKQLRDEGWFETSVHREPNLREALDLVALGTIADVVPLVGANRILVTHGLREIEHTKRIGLQALKVVSLVDGRVAAGEVGFKIGPRINAAGRLDDAGAAVQLLLTTDQAEAERLAGELDRANAERRKIEQVITTEAFTQAYPIAEKVRGLVLSAEGWHPGVVGIVASRVAERFHRPAIIIGVDGEMARGSCRSIEKFDMYGSLGRCASHLIRFGGHHHAAGLQIEPDKIEGFRQAFQKEATRQLSPKDLVPIVRVDADLRAADATLELAQALEALAPFGSGHPEPVFATEVSRTESRILPAKTGVGDHLKFKVGPADGIAFGLADRQGVLRGNAKVAFQLQVNEWNGRVTPSAKVKAIEPRRA